MTLFEVGERSCLFLACKEVNSLSQRTQQHRNNIHFPKLRNFDASCDFYKNFSLRIHVKYYFIILGCSNLMSAATGFRPPPQSQKQSEELTHRKEMLKNLLLSRKDCTNLASVLPSCQRNQCAHPILASHHGSPFPPATTQVLMFSLQPVFCTAWGARIQVLSFGSYLLVYLWMRNTIDLHLLLKLKVTTHQGLSSFILLSTAES